MSDKGALIKFVRPELVEGNSRETQGLREAQPERLEEEISVSLKDQTVRMCRTYHSAVISSPPGMGSPYATGCAQCLFGIAISTQHRCK